MVVYILRSKDQSSLSVSPCPPPLKASESPPALHLPEHQIRSQRQLYACLDISAGMVQSFMLEDEHAADFRHDVELARLIEGMEDGGAALELAVGGGGVGLVEVQVQGEEGDFFAVGSGVGAVHMGWLIGLWFSGELGR